jgi:cyclopropane fatty-acyl-phospholipid synthase-like methyltransferase
MDCRTQTEVFWDHVYESTTYSRELDESVGCALKSARTFFQPGEGHKVLDIGCGAGATSIFWADTGADVTAIDCSVSAIALLRERCEKLGIANITPIVGNAMNIEELGQFDYVFGANILHHLEPFGEFARALKRTIRVNGRAFFYENNAASDLLVWFRKKVVGKLWVPKYGDPDEFPLTRQEINVLRESFIVNVSFPEMVFFQLASVYLFRNRLAAEMKAIDKFLYKRNVGVHYSYRQYVQLEAVPPGE